MSDLRWLKALAGPEFRRADTQRDERGAAPGKAVERWLRDLPGWLPVRTESAARIAALSVAVRATPLLDAPDTIVVATLHAATAALRTNVRRDVRRDARKNAKDAAALALALAAVAEAARRCLGLRPHPVQLAGVRLLITGRLAEMRTGEGKTLVAALAATVVAASGARVHIVSSNDYLAERDCAQMAPLFAFFGLTAGFIQGGMAADARREAYRQSVCFAAGKELVFDYLKDRLAGHGLLPARVAELRGFVGAGAGVSVAASIANLPITPYM